MKFQTGLTVCSLIDIDRTEIIHLLQQWSRTHPLWVCQDFGHMHGDSHLINTQIWIGRNDRSAREVHSFS